MLHVHRYTGDLVSDLTTWQRRWAKTSAELIAANDEITRLRTVLEEATK